MKKALIIILSLMAFTVFGADNRIDNDFGLSLGVYDPIPGSFGLGVNWNVTSFLRLSGALSSYSNGENNFLEEGLESILAGLFYVLLLGKVDYDDVRDFCSMDEDVPRHLFSYAGGINFYVPGWNLSPTAGVQIGKYVSKNHPFGLPEEQSFVSYRFGLEWQSQVGLMVGAGYAYSPALEIKDFRNKFYAQLGWMF